MSLHLALLPHPFGFYGLSLLSNLFPFGTSTPEDQPEEAEDQPEEAEDQPDEAENDAMKEFKDALLSHQDDPGYVAFLRFPNRGTGCLQRVNLGMYPFNTPFADLERMALYQFKDK